MNKFISILFFSFATISHAQTKHYISIGGVLYTNYFNKEQDKLQTISKYLSLPNINYKIERERWGAEIYYTHSYTTYNTIKEGAINEGDINYIYYQAGGLNIHYLVFQHERVKVSPFIGVNYSKYHAKVFDGWRQPPLHLYYPKEITHDEDEKNFGFQTGVNINIPVYWGFYVNTNVRYTILPGAAYNRQNLFWEIGLGYCIQRKNRQSK